MIAAQNIGIDRQLPTTSRPAGALHEHVDELSASARNVTRVVWTATKHPRQHRGVRDPSNSPRPTIALCMGEAGLISRVLAKKFDAFLTFASLEPGAARRRGRVSIHDMKRLYRWDALNAKTKIYGVVGSPIMHSMSPAIHNAAFETVATTACTCRCS
jgi:3-dehydroquinate dehydratase/shikimate dehydrogenase